MRLRCGAHLAALDFEPEVILATFHGMPQAYLEQGDPYHCQCQKTSRLLRAALGWPADSWLTTFQSRFGNDPWLQPYTDETVKRLAARGREAARARRARLLRRLPGDAGGARPREPRTYFMASGGEKFAYLPALNDSEDGMRVIEAVVRRELKGWA